MDSSRWVLFYIILFVALTTMLILGITPINTVNTPTEFDGYRQVGKLSENEESQAVLVNGQRFFFPEDIVLRDTAEKRMLPVNFTDNDVREQYQRTIGRIELECRRDARMGAMTDGGWNVCIVPPYDLKPPCLVYDFGIAAKWSFDDDISEKYGCTVRAFDPTNGLEEHNRSSLIHFYPIGLWGSNGQYNNFTVKTFKTLLQQFGEENKTVDYLKIDIEDCEWNSLDTMLKDGSLKHVKQIGLEVHAFPKSSALLLKTYMYLLNQLKAAGFMQWKDDWNMHMLRHFKPLGCLTRCHELYFVNVNFLKQYS